MEHLLSLVGDWMKGAIAAGGYPGIALLMALESACIPLPSEIIMPFAGSLTLAAFAAGGRPLDFNAVALAGAIGCAAGSALAYFVGATGGREFVLRYGRYLLIRRHDVELSESWFRRFGAAAVFVSRMLPVVRTFISLPAGIARMPFGRFIALSFIGSVPWCYLLAYAGVQFARHLDDLKVYFHRADAVIVAAFLVLAAFWLWRHLRRETTEAPAREGGRG